MLPSKCPLCNLELSANFYEKHQTYDIICPNKNDSPGKFKPSHYFYRVGFDISDIHERIIIGKYLIYNSLVNEKLSSQIFLKAASFNPECSPKIIVKIDGVRIPPTITESKIHTYIVFS